MRFAFLLLIIAFTHAQIIPVVYFQHGQDGEAQFQAPVIGVLNALAALGSQLKDYLDNSHSIQDMTQMIHTLQSEKSVIDKGAGSLIEYSLYNLQEQLTLNKQTINQIKNMALQLKESAIQFNVTLDFVSGEQNLTELDKTVLNSALTLLKSSLIESQDNNTKIVSQIKSVANQFWHTIETKNYINLYLKRFADGEGKMYNQKLKDQKSIVYGGICKPICIATLGTFCAPCHKLASKTIESEQNHYKSQVKDLKSKFKSWDNIFIKEIKNIQNLNEQTNSWNNKTFNLQGDINEAIGFLESTTVSASFLPDGELVDEKVKALIKLCNNLIDTELPEVHNHASEKKEKLLEFFSQNFVDQCSITQYESKGYCVSVWMIVIPNIILLLVITVIGFYYRKKRADRKVKEESSDVHETFSINKEQ